MNPRSTTTPGPAGPSDCQVAELSIAQLVGEVFETAPVAERGRLLEPLLRPLGVLSLAAIANGIFAKVRFRSGWQDFHVRPEDAALVRGSDVVALVDYVQQVSVEAMDALGRTLAASPALAASAAAAVLVVLLAHGPRAGRSDLRFENLPAALA